MKMSKLDKIRRQKTEVRHNSCLSFIICCLLSVVCCLFISPAFADEYHYKNILIGDRSAGMGGAYTAVSDDPSGLYYNPAGIVYAVGASLSISANAYHQTNTEYKDVIGSNGWKRQSSALIPNFFGIVQPLWKGKVGFSYAVSDSIVEDQDQTFYNIPGITKYVINFNNNNTTYNFGPSYALELTKGLSMGITLYAHYRENQWILNQLSNLKTGQYEWINQYYQTTEWGIRPIFGLMWSPKDKLSLGITYGQNRVISTNTTNQIIIKDKSYDGNTISRDEISTDVKRELPYVTTLGIAYFPSNNLIISSDFTYYTATTDNNFGDKEAIWNAAIGTEYYLTDSWAVRGGIFSDRANTKEIKTGDINAFDHIDLYGASLSISNFTRQSSITFGTTYRYGNGKAQILGNSQIQDVDMKAVTFLISAGYKY